mmetsp:Transcript_25137/g.59306  ORF Transcript_25137/g.59306 Transcript_25137/m.59306 type:complete len:252 (+) Transcript_25137:149-904(+)|eukprot:CAMPEP_0172398344 /NCGR_PEP_ID=MMETSP1061-20121228/35452_1 /TAXON_ID=37318 /ORGANISM="Pseudo-nitzschia pungens, Strain cf. pungens" /LENGTH=251 /DNA_ID=CAMNT_0013130795 /DNA_START=123 /DNA_END=878 /DNA_ORIENTATION=-
MTVRINFFFLLTLAIACCDENVYAWIPTGPPFHRRAARSDHVVKNRMVPITSGRSRLSVDSTNDSNENEDIHITQQSSRRSFVQQSHILVLVAATITAPSSAYAKYGEGTSMELPSYIDYLIEKNTAADNSEALYKGADPATVLRRLAESESRLGEIRGLAEQKKWSQINGIITGPLGTLSSTMSQIVSIVLTSPTTSPKKIKQVQEIVKKVKADIISIGQAASRKDTEECTKQSANASNDLKALLEIAFE